MIPGGTQKDSFHSRILTIWFWKIVLKGFRRAERAGGILRFWGPRTSRKPGIQYSVFQRIFTFLFTGRILIGNEFSDGKWIILIPVARKEFIVLKDPDDLILKELFWKLRRAERAGGILRFWGPRTSMEPKIQ